MSFEANKQDFKVTSVGRNALFFINVSKAEKFKYMS